MKQTYKDYQDEVASEQKDMKYEEIKEKMKQRSEFLLELDNLPAQNHIWIDRGAKFTCENAGHVAHEAWKKQR